MSPRASVASEYLRVQNPSEANETVVNGSNNLEFSPGKHQAKPRFLKDLSRIKPQMMLKLLSSNKLSEDKKVDFAFAEGFNRQAEASSHEEMMELFPLSTGFGSNPRVTERNITLPSEIGLTDPNSSKCVLAKVPEKPSTAQLTIFYNGAMNVYDMPTAKAQAIMKLASANSSSKTRISTITSGKIEQISQQQPSKPALNAVNENQPQKLAVGMEIVRKLSLQRFLQKRKERFNSVAPYSTMETATSPWKAGKDSDDQIILSLSCP